MNELLSKLSTYNIFNYLLPGVIFAVLAEKLTSVNLIQENLLLGAFLYYFLGLVISRVGSLIIEPVLKKTRFVAFSSYNDFVSASEKDAKLEVLSEVNNMYRTFCSAFMLLGTIILYENLSAKWPKLPALRADVLMGVLLVLFLFAYRKQTKYIRDRVLKQIEKE